MIAIKVFIVYAIEKKLSCIFYNRTTCMTAHCTVGHLAELKHAPDPVMC